MYQTPQRPPSTNNGCAGCFTLVILFILFVGCVYGFFYFDDKGPDLNHLDYTTIKPTPTPFVKDWNDMTKADKEEAAREIVKDAYRRGAK